MFGVEFILIVLAIAYLSLIYELVVIPVPSVASTYQLFYSDDVEGVLNKASCDNGLLKRVQSWPSSLKFFALLLPTSLSVINFCFPLVYLFLPDAWQTLLSIDFLNGDFSIFVGVILIVIGRVLSLCSVIQIRKQNSQVDDDFDLKTQGPFGLSRNPILVGMYLFYWGIFFLIPNWISLFGFLIYAANMHFRVILEEDFLSQLYGEKFDNYYSKTRRYL